MGGELILVIDDNRQIADFLGREVLPALGYKTLQAGTGSDALLKVQRHKPDLLLLDLQLPDMDGFAILRRLEEEGLSRPTILMTAHGSEQIAVEAFRMGVQDYLIKPVNAADIEQALNRALTETRLRRERAALVAQLRQQVTRLEVLSRIGRSLTSSLDLDQVLLRIVEACIYLTQAEEGFLMLLDEQSDELYLRAAKNLDQREAAVLRTPVKDSLIGQVIRSGQPLRLGHSRTEGLLKIKTGYLVQNLLHVPLKFKGRVMGVLSVDNRLSSRTFSEADEALMLALADLAVIALDNARLYQEAEQRAEQALVYAQDLREVYKREKQQRQALDRLRFSFLNVIGHELKTPVTNIMQSLEAMVDPRWGTLNEKQHELLDTLEKQSAYLSRLIDGLVDFAAFTAKQGALQQRRADLAPIIQRALQLALFKAQQKKITIQEQVDDGLPPLFIDPERVEEALNQLLDNAVKFNRQGGQVELRAVATAGAVQVSVRDTGQGIPPTELDSIWQGFCQIGRTMEFGLEGLGLGLALTRYIVEAHGGTVEVESELGVGSTFTITLPLAEEAG